MDLSNLNPLLIIALIVFIVYYWLSQNSPTAIRKEQEKQQAYHDNINTATMRNQNYRQVLKTTNNMQLVLMSLQPKEEIGMETHLTTSQFIRIEEGSGLAIINGKQYPLEDDTAIIIPPGAPHNVINLHPTNPLKLYSIYTPPNHPANTLQAIKPQNHHH